MTNGQDAESSSKGRILVAEDVRAIAEMITWALENAGFETAIAADGEECLERVESFQPDLIVLDIMMPKIHGFDVLRRLREDEATQSIEVIICTGKGFRTDISWVEELGVSDLVIKPFEPRYLVAKVEKVLGDRDDTMVSGTHRRPSLEELEGVFLPEVEAAGGRLRFWGTRGSIPVCGQQYLRHGGNTTCLEFNYGGERIIFDAGSGIRNLGRSLLEGEPCKLHLFITHTHWDHIQGFPFFAPAFTPGFDITVYGVRGFNKNLETLFRGQLDPDYFPIQMENMDARLEFVSLDERPVQIGDISISWIFTQHPGTTIGYKIDFGGRSVAFVPDNEIFQGYMGPPEAVPRDRDLLTIYQPIIEFLTDVDLLIHEAQFTQEEYRQSVRYGHSSVSNACALVKFVNARRWLIVHHDPNHSDVFLDEKLSLTRQLLRRLDHPIEVSHAYDGLIEYP